MNLIMLKNGAEETDVVVTTAMLSIKKLMQVNPIAFHELVELARNPDHILFGDTGQRLVSLALIQQDKGSFSMHESVRNILLSAVEGEGLDMRIVNPVKIDV